MGFVEFFLLQLPIVGEAHAARRPHRAREAALGGAVAVPGSAGAARRFVPALRAPGEQDAVAAGCKVVGW